MSSSAHSESATAAMLRPARLCGELLAALDASEGRRKRRVRDTTPDAIGMRIKRELLERCIGEDPDPADFEAWLAERCLEAGVADGPVRAMALSIRDEWYLAARMEAFRQWLAHGAPSDDRDGSPLDPRRLA